MSVCDSYALLCTCLYIYIYIIIFFNLQTYALVFIAHYASFLWEI